VAGLEWLSALVAAGAALGVLAVRAARGTGAGGEIEVSDSIGASRSAVNSVYPEQSAFYGRVVPLRDESASSAAVAELLRDFRDTMGGEEVIFWKWDEGKDSLRPQFWSSDSDRPRRFRMQEWGALVQWSAEERIVHVGGDGERPHVVSAPVTSDGRLLGVLSTSAESGLRLTRPGALEWQGRHARQLATLLDLQQLQRSQQVTERRARLLLEAAQRIQSRGEPDQLLKTICLSAQALTGASTVLLIRWDGALGRATIQHATPAGEAAAGSALPPESLVAHACEAGLPTIFADATHLSGSTIVGPALVAGNVGSVAVVPLVRDGETIGAVVALSEEVDRMAQEEGRNLAILGSMAISALEMVWTVEEAGRTARTDVLTGLPNRLAFEEQLKRVLNETDRFGGACSLVLLDLDGFKQINDTLGHPAGDAILGHVARVLLDGIRTVDVAARVGGEELAVILPQTGLVGAAEVAERLRAKLERSQPVVAGRPLRVTASFGVASYPERAKSRDGLFQAADGALYAAKSSGRNCVRATPIRGMPQLT
jgi:diguanylate cyclase (GGDEF)-like protein